MGAFDFTSIIDGASLSDENWDTDWDDLVYQCSRNETTRTPQQTNPTNFAAEPNHPATDAVQATNRKVDTTATYFASIPPRFLCDVCQEWVFDGRDWAASWNTLARVCDWCKPPPWKGGTLMDTPTPMHTP